MIASLRGVLTEKQLSSCVVEASGVGYMVHVSSHTLKQLPAIGDEVQLRTRQVFREDAVLLFGFADAEELQLFDLMIGVSGVGPKLALAVLSGLRPGALVRAIREEQIGALVAIPGIGRKTAERLVVELRDKLEGLAIAPVAAVPVAKKETRVLPRAERFDDSVAALVRLGYTAAQAEEAVRRVGEEGDDLSAEDLVRRSLAMLTRPAAVR
jgi:Holliday junction DNA helicase RuvA